MISRKTQLTHLIHSIQSDPSAYDFNDVPTNMTKRQVPHMSILQIIRHSSTDKRESIVGLIPIPETLPPSDCRYSRKRSTKLPRQFCPPRHVADSPRRNACHRRNRQNIQDTGRSGHTPRRRSAPNRSTPRHHRCARTRSRQQCP